MRGIKNIKKLHSPEKCDFKSYYGKIAETFLNMLHLMWSLEFLICGIPSLLN